MAFDNPARRSIVVEMVPTEYVNNAVSLNSALMTSSRIFGPALAGLLIHTVGFGWCFLTDAVSYVAVLVGLWMMRPGELRRPPPRPRTKGDVRADPNMRGRVLALQAMVFLGSTPIGGPILGAICEYLGARAGLVVGGVSALIAAAYGQSRRSSTIRRFE